MRGRPAASSAIALAGSGRSGTTWLMEVLAASPGVQPVFEPLNPEWNRRVRVLVGTDGRPHVGCWYLRPQGDYPEWEKLLERVFSGRVRSYRTDSVRTTYCPTVFLVKLIRANLALGYISDHLHPRIVFMTRHPCAVVHSRLALGWRADTRDLLRQSELVEDHLAPWVHDIEKERDPLGAHAVWWAVENLVATRDLATRPHCAVTYEGLCLDPTEEARRVVDWLGIQCPGRLGELLGRPSRQSRRGVEYESAMARLSAWKRHLSAGEQRRILDWAQRVGVGLYDDGILPVALQSATGD